MRKTQAVVIPEPGVVELQEVTLRDAGPDDVVIQTAYTSISAGTERMLLAGQMPHPMLQLPVVPGYETVGRIVEIGENVPEEWDGRWVYVGGALCFEGVNAAWGGQSATIITDVKRVLPLDSIEPRLGVLLALTATALHGLDVLKPQANDRIIVLGQGPVGQLTTRIACAQDIYVISVDRSESRLSHAIGDEIINVGDIAIVDVIEQQVSAIVEASGSMPALAATLPLLAEHGTILLLGYYQTLEIPYMPLFLKEAQLLTAREWGSDDLARSRDMIADGSLEVASLLTHEYAIEDIAQGYETALNDPDCLKLVLDWHTSD